jgi:hypothetical protein
MPLFAFGRVVAPVILQTVTSAFCAWDTSSLACGKPDADAARAPDVPSDASQSPDKYLLPLIALTGFCWMRTSELVRLYASEDSLAWEDIDWHNERIHVRESVGKSTRDDPATNGFRP